MKHRAVPAISAQALKNAEQQSMQGGLEDNILENVGIERGLCGQECFLLFLKDPASIPSTHMGARRLPSTHCHA